MTEIYDFTEHRIDQIRKMMPETKLMKYRFSVQKIVETTVMKTMEMIGEGITDPETIRNTILIEIDHIRLVYGEYDIRF